MNTGEWRRIVGRDCIRGMRVRAAWAGGVRNARWLVVFEVIPVPS